MKLHSDFGMYKLCIRARTDTDVSVLLLGSETPVHLQINKEVLLKSDVERLIGPRPYSSHSVSELYENAMAPVAAIDSDENTPAGKSSEEEA